MADGLLRISTRPRSAVPRRERRERPDWLQKVEQAVLQEPLFASTPSRLGLERLMWSMARPGAVFLGIGICGPRQLSRGLPFDVLGMLLPAEQLRAAIGAPLLHVWVADVNAELNALDPAQVAHRASVTTRTLLRIRSRLGLEHMTVTRASSVQHDPAYNRLLERAREAAGSRANPYAVQQAADVAHAHVRLGGIVKVGWVMSRNRRVGTNLDEVAFDQWVEDWTGVTPSFAYVRPGRVLDDRAPKAAPYIELSPARRIQIDPREDVLHKLSHARVSRQTRNGVKNQLRAITHTYARMVERVPGTPAERAQAIIRRLYRPRPLVMVDDPAEDARLSSPHARRLAP